MISIFIIDLPSLVDVEWNERNVMGNKDKSCMESRCSISCSVVNAKTEKGIEAFHVKPFSRLNLYCHLKSFLTWREPPQSLLLFQ